VGHPSDPLLSTQMMTLPLLQIFPTRPPDPSSRTLLPTYSNLNPLLMSLLQLARDAANPSRLNDAWRTFFRQSLIADNPAQPTLPGTNNQTGTPPDLPPPLYTAPNNPCGDAFEHKTRGSFRMWSVNARGISSKDYFATSPNFTLCASVLNPDRWMQS
jgi:hypothetical protein